MALKLFISDYTHRQEADQLKKLRAEPGLQHAPVFRPADMSAMFRPTTRPGRDTYYAVSIACFAPKRERFEEFVAQCRKRKICLASIEEKIEWKPNQSTAGLVKLWRTARVAGAAKVGGDRNGAKWKERNKDGIEIARSLWCLPSTQHSIKDVEAASGLSRGAIVRALGNRIPAQINYQAAQKRKERRDAQRTK